LSAAMTVWESMIPADGCAPRPRLGGPRPATRPAGAASPAASPTTRSTTTPSKAGNPQVTAAEHIPYAPHTTPHPPPPPRMLLRPPALTRRWQQRLYQRPLSSVSSEGIARGLRHPARPNRPERSRSHTDRDQLLKHSLNRPPRMHGPATDLLPMPPTDCPEDLHQPFQRPPPTSFPGPATACGMTATVLQSVPVRPQNLDIEARHHLRAARSRFHRSKAVTLNVM
jgi:hypothetical protein